MLYSQPPTRYSRPMSKTTTAVVVPFGSTGRPRRTTGLLFADDATPIVDLDEMRPLLRAASRRRRNSRALRSFDLSPFLDAMFAKRSR